MNPVLDTLIEEGDKIIVINNDLRHTNKMDEK